MAQTRLFLNPLYRFKALRHNTYDRKKERKKEENLHHFVFCNAYENKTLEVHWKDIFGHDVERQ